MKLTLYLIEDDTDFAKVLLKLLASSLLIDVVGHATTLAQAREFIRHQSVDVFVVDISLPDGNGIDIMREIRNAYVHAKIMVLTTLGHEKHIVSSLQAGASGYLLKSEMPVQIIQSIVTVANNGGSLGQHAAKVLIEKVTQQPAVTSQMFKGDILVTSEELEMLQGQAESDFKKPTHLTPREIEILKEMQIGATTKQIAKVFGISAYTVNQHLRNIYSKLGVHNKMEAVQAGRQLRVI